MYGVYINIIEHPFILRKIELWFTWSLSRYLIIVVTALWQTLTLFQVPTEVPPEGGGTIHTADARHRRHGDTSGASHAVPPQSANLSQRPGHTQLRVSFDASHTSVISRTRPVVIGLSKCTEYILRASEQFRLSPHNHPLGRDVAKTPCISLHRILCFHFVFTFISLPVFKTEYRLHIKSFKT